MKKRIATILCLALAATAARAEVVGAMADSSSGTIWPAVVESRMTNLEAKAGAAVAISSVATNFAGGQDTGLSVDGQVLAVYSDTETDNALRIRFDTNFPASRLAWEDWIGSATEIAVNETNGYEGVFDAAPAAGVTNGVAFWVAGDETPHWLDAFDPDTLAATFHPALEPNETFALSRIQAAVVDSFGIHYGEGGGESTPYAQLASSPSGNYPALATADGVTVYMSYSGGRVWKSVDGGDSWAQLASSPSGNNPALATADGVTVYLCYSGGRVWKSVDGGDSWAQLASSPSGDWPALATADGVTVYMSYKNGRVWKSVDGGDSWAQLASSPSGDYPALATADGVTVYMSYSGGRVWKSVAIFGSGATEPYSVVVLSTTRNIEKIKDFAASANGKPSTFWTLELAPDTWGIWGAGEYPLRWRTTAAKSGGVWHVRDTNGVMVATDAQDAASAVSRAIAANPLNRLPMQGYSPVYGYDGFTGGIPAAWCCTFVPTVATNTPWVSGMALLYSAYGDAMHLDTHHYRVDIASTNPVTSTVKWTGDTATQSEIYYIKNDDEEEQE